MHVDKDLPLRRQTLPWSDNNAMKPTPTTRPAINGACNLSSATTSQESSISAHDYSNMIRSLEDLAPDSPPPICSSFSSSSNSHVRSSYFARLLADPSSSTPAIQEMSDEDLMIRPKPYSEYLDEFKKQDLEAKVESWRRAREETIMDKLKRKEAGIQEWECKQTRKATEEMSKYEMKLEKKRAKAMEKLQRKIRLAKAEAYGKTTKAKREAIERMSEVSRMSIKARATKNLACLKS